MKKLFVACFVCFFAVSSSVVLAETAISRKLNYVGITAGGVSDEYLFGDKLDSKIKFPDRPDRVSLPDVDLSGGYTLGIRCGHLLQPPYTEDIAVELAAEVEAFIITGTDVDNKFYGRHEFVPIVTVDGDISTDVTVDGDISIEVIMLNFLLRYPHGSVHPYGGIGIGWAWFDCDTVLSVGSEFTWPGTDSNINDLGKLDDNTFAGQVRLGCELDVTEAFSLDLGYRYFRIDRAELDSSDFDLHMKYEVDMLTVGLIYRF